MQIALLKNSNTSNIGDTIQTLAVAQHVDQAYSLVERDFLHQYEGEPCAVVMNGWFTHEPRNWPPTPSIVPIFFGFHVSPAVVGAFEKHKDYFARFAPIGCRDAATAALFTSWGIDAYVSGCATMTFPNRKREPERPKTMLVDQKHAHFRRAERRSCVSITHEFPAYFVDAAARLKAAGELLAYYRDNAGLVIASRIHCVLPCAAIGVPVVYTGIREDRTAIIDSIGIPAVKTRRFPPTRIAGLPAFRPEFEDLKQKMTADLHRRLVEHGVRVRDPAAIASA